jgi:hypothetical protein
MTSERLISGTDVPFIMIHENLTVSMSDHFTGHGFFPAVNPDYESPETSEVDMPSSRTYSMDVSRRDNQCDRQITRNLSKTRTRVINLGNWHDKLLYHRLLAY